MQDANQTASTIAAAMTIIALSDFGIETLVNLLEEIRRQPLLGYGWS